MMINNTQQLTWQQLKQELQDDNLSLSERFDKLFQFGLEVFNLELGIISHIKNGIYTIEYTTNPDFIGQGFKLGDTYCSITVKQSGNVLGIRQMGVSEFLRHPAYGLFQLEAYIGASIMVNGKLYGTINFTKPDARISSFTAEEKSLLNEMATFVGELLEKHQA